MKACCSDHERRGTGRRWLRWVLPLVLVLALVLALSSSARLDSAEFSFVNGAEPASLDPATVTGIPEQRLVRFLFEGLCIKDPQTLEPVPGVAESWTISEDGREYRFHLREDARWSNGDPVTAHDFAWSFERLLDPRTAAEYAYQLGYVRGASAFTASADASGAPRLSFDTVAIRALSDRERAIGLDEPVPYFLDLVASPPLFPVHRRSIEELRARYPDTWQIEWTKPGHLVTNGPYVLAERRINDRIRFVKNPRYWDAARVAFESVDALAVEQVGTALNLYLSGEVGLATAVPVELVPELSRREDFHAAPYLGSYFYRVNVTRPPFDDVRVRRALALAIPRRAIVERITRAGERPSWSHVPPGMRGYEPVELAHARTGDETADRAADLEEARALLAEAGFGPGAKPLPSIEILYNTQGAHGSIAEVIADAWRRELGLETRLANQEWKVFLASQSGLAYDVSRSSWIGDYPDPYGFLDVFEETSRNNRTGWISVVYDALLQRARQARGERRTDLLRAAEELLMRELPILPIYSYATANLVDPRLGGFEENALDEHFPKFWRWLDEAELAEKRARLPAGKQIVDRSPRASAGAHAR
jgi:oligopeptide transport system substrate-binding protein